MTDTQKDTPEKESRKIGKVVKMAGKSALWTAKHLRSILKTGALIGALAVGGHAYRQFNKTPKEAHEDTVKITQEVGEEVDSLTKTNEVAHKVARPLAEMGARHGGALREWLVKKRWEKKHSK